MLLRISVLGYRELGKNSLLTTFAASFRRYQPADARKTQPHRPRWRQCPCGERGPSVVFGLPASLSEPR